MEKPIFINKHSVHLWRIVLSEQSAQEKNLMSLLSQDEIDRAKRFKFDIHRQRHIVTRATLRRILARYLALLPAEIIFFYNKHGKPFLQNNSQQLQFNVSHSDDMAVIAITPEYQIGVDIERIEQSFKEGVAKRFFSPDEYHDLQQLSDEEKVIAFYRIWAKKEALIKALGEGLYTPLDSFSVTYKEGVESIHIMHENKPTHYHVQSFFVHEDYSAAFATDQTVANIEYFQW